jgi:hypothetical protein
MIVLRLFCANCGTTLFGAGAAFLSLLRGAGDEASRFRARDEDDALPLCSAMPRNTTARELPASSDAANAKASEILHRGILAVSTPFSTTGTLSGVSR